MDVDTLALRIKTLEDKLAIYEPMLAQELPGYQKHVAEQKAEVDEVRQGLYADLIAAGVTSECGNARCAAFTGNESVDELRTMLEAAKLGQEEAAAIAEQEAANAEAHRVEQERLVKENADKAEADRLEAERVAKEEADLAEEQRQKMKAAEAAEAKAVLEGQAQPASSDGPVAHPALQDPENPAVEHADVIAARDKGKKAFIKYAMKDAGMSEDEANWAWEHPPARTED